MTDWGYKAQKAAEDRLYACNEWQAWHEEGGEQSGEPEPDVPDPSTAPYCGCETCMIREVLDAAWPIIEEAVRSGDFD